MHPRRARLGLIEVGESIRSSSPLSGIRGARASASLKYVDIIVVFAVCCPRHPRRARLGLIEVRSKQP